MEYILEKEKRARRGSQDINKITRLRAWLITKVSNDECICTYFFKDLDLNSKKLFSNIF